MTTSPSRRSAIVPIVLAQLGLHSAMSGTRMAAPLEVLRAEQGAFAAGALLAMFALAPVALALPAGRMADRHGYHRPMRIAVALVIAGTLVAAASTLAGASGHLFALVLAALLCGTGANAAAITTQRTAGRIAADSIERVRVFSWLGMAPALGNAVGPVTAGVVIDAMGFGWAYLAMAALSLVSLLAIPRVPREAALAASRGPRQRARTLFAVPRFTRLLLVNGLISASWDVHSFAVPVLGHERGFSASTIGLILAAFTLAVAGVRVVIPMVAARLDEVRVIRTVMVATGLVFAVYPLMPGPWSMAACAVVLGVMLGSAQPMIMSTLMHIVPAQRQGESLALRSMMINASSVGMPLIWGLLGAAVGAASLFWVMGAMVAGGNLVAKRLRAQSIDGSSADTVDADGADRV